MSYDDSAEWPEVITTDADFATCIVTAVAPTNAPKRHSPSAANLIAPLRAEQHMACAH